MSDYTLLKEHHYLVGGLRQIRDKDERLIGYARDLDDARRQMNRRDGGTVAEEEQ